MQVAEQVMKVSQEIQNNAETIVGISLFKSGRWAIDENVRIWRGYARDLATKLDLTVGQVSNALSLLDTVGSISLVTRSNQYRPALYVFLKPIEMKDLLELKERSLITGDLKTTTKNQRVNDTLNRAINRIDKLEMQTKILTRNLQKLEDRIRQFGEVYGIDSGSSTLPEVSGDGNPVTSSGTSG